MEVRLVGRGRRSRESDRQTGSAWLAACCEPPDQYFYKFRVMLTAFSTKRRRAAPGTILGRMLFFVPACCGGETEDPSHQGLCYRKQNNISPFGEPSLEREGVERSREEGGCAGRLFI